MGDKIYLDYAATTPVDRRVLDAMRPYFSELFGNPGSLHSFGQEAIAAMDRSRETIARILGAKFEEIVFTGSATEANNLALRGSAAKKIIVSAVEHKSVLETARDLEKDGIEVVVLPVKGDGTVHLEKLKSALDERTALVSIMYANNEVGTIQPIAEISKVVKSFNPKILIHTDAVQAFQYLDCDVNMLGVDLLTLSAHKIYGPKGVGALYVRDLKSKTYNLKPVITGGGHELGLRSGTENVPNIVGFAKALELAAGARKEEKRRVGKIRDYFWNGLKEIYSTALRNGGLPAQAGGPALPNFLNVYFPGYKAEDLLLKFDKSGIAVSAGSACSARGVLPSHVLRALGFPDERVESSIRFSLGRFSGEREIKEVLTRIKTW
jgi:cysteine desulfurase